MSKIIVIASVVLFLPALPARFESEEPTCTRYHYESQILERIIKAEIAWDTTGRNAEQLTEEMAELKRKYQRDVHASQVEIESLKDDFRELRKNLTQPPKPDSMRSFCLSDADCSDFASSECKRLTCKCKPGLSYHKATRQCLPDCGDFGYGDTYQEERGAAIKGLNNKIISSVSVVECVRACTSETTFICRSIEYNSGNQDCQLTVETLYTSSQHVYDIPPPGWDFFFTRNCN